jgi:flagellar protein FlaI
MKDKSVRRMVHVAEIVGHESSSDQIVLNNAFKWDPVSDKYMFGGRSRLFDKITKRYGTPPEKIRQDIEERRIILTWLVKKNIRDYRDLSQQIREFYADPNKTIDRAMRALEEEKA